ncbi:sensor histidine kinase [Geodermatophilus sp. URMC 64]
MSAQQITTAGTVRVARAGALLRVVAWAIVPLYAAGLVTSLVLRARVDAAQRVNPAEGVPILVGFGLSAVLGALLVSRRPGNPLGWLLSGTAVLISLAVAGDAWAEYVVTTTGRADALATFGAWLQSWYWFVLLGLVVVGLPLLFPDGRLPSRRWRLVTALPVAGVGTAAVLGMLSETISPHEVDFPIDNPIGIAGLPPVEQSPVFGVLSALLVVGLVEGVAAVVVRWRRSHGEERQQMKWFLFAVAPVVLLPLDQLPWVSGVAFAWVLIALPVAVAVAVLRYRLDGIDVVLDRTLVYAGLTAVVVAVYVLVVGWLGGLLHRQDDLVVSLVATGLVAVLFAPLRDRLQRGVSRLLYGSRAEPYAALSRLGERLEGTLAPDAVLPTIVTTVREALRLPYAAIVLPDDDRPVAAAGEPVPEPVRLPLTYRNAEVGALLLAPRSGESGFSPADRRLLSDLARQAGVAVSAVRLTADLQRSRELLVGAREEERRRLRRDLHDGLGAQLAGLTVQAGVLRSLVARDPAAAQELAGELRQELRTAIADIRRLVHGLRPPALDELGLRGALERLAERSTADDGLRVAVETPAELPALPAAVEVAVYRIVQEALANVVRHAAAATCTVRLDVDPAEVCVTVTDDGAGFAPGSPGVGLASMRERAEEMGGVCTVGPGPCGGTVVRARLPRTGGTA